MFSSALATLNFSLSFLIGLSAAPLTFVRPISPSTPASRRIALAALQYAVLVALSPVVVVGVASQELMGKGLANGEWAGAVGTLDAVRQVLVQAAFGWHVWGLWTQVVVWLVWWPAWFVGAVVVTGSFFS